MITAPQETSIELDIAALVIDSEIQVRHSEHRATVDRYKESLDSLPPVTVYDTAEGLLLSDGFHRVKAHTRSNRTVIYAHVRSGTREDALEYAVTGNCRHGAALTPDERDAGIHRLHHLHPEWPASVIAEKMSVHRTTVDRVVKAHEVTEDLGGEAASGLSRAVLTSIKQAPVAAQPALARRAQDEGLTAAETQRAAQSISTEEAKPAPAARYDADHGERLKVGRARVRISYMVPSGRTRDRGGHTYDRENVPIERSVTVNLGPDAFEPGKTGAVATANAIAKEVYATLMREGWPVPLAGLPE